MTENKGLDASSSSTAVRTCILLITFLISFLAAIPTSTCALALEGVGAAPSQQGKAATPALFLVSSPSREKRDMHQLCGYRLLDTLRSVCDRNFVSRRSDPSLFVQGAGEGQLSTEDVSGAISPGNNPWDSLTLEYPQYPGQPAPSSGDINPLNLDDLEYLQAPLSLPFPVWPRTNKAFALKMLVEPPKTHQRFRRNIIDECCKKPCAMNQMLKYCAAAGAGKRSFPF